MIWVRDVLASPPWGRRERGLICNASRRVIERSLDAMKNIDELGLLLLGEHCHPCFLMLMDEQPEILRHLTTRVGQFDQQHPPVTGVRYSAYVSATLQ